MRFMLRQLANVQLQMRPTRNVLTMCLLFAFNNAIAAIYN